ncbi:nucleotidyltransferase [Pantoea agglomerans]|uniref:nucleotidyltransferase n=1 Tax=Enterobacter agglomerans TaxID=549 RepID=UPI0037C8B86C
MAYSVNAAFSTLMNDFVNLEPDASRSGKVSRDWLVDKQIINFPENDDKFPLLYPEPKMWFGSFSRKTKIRELDDIDLMIIMHAERSFYSQLDNTFFLSPGENSRYLNYTDSSGSYINSRRVVNKFVSSLSAVWQYASADTKRQGEAATLKLKSYSWNFDIVPAFMTAPDAHGETFYLIPDGDGNWKRTDPRIDKERTTRLNRKHDAKMLNIIRLVKYWKRKRAVPAINSYVLETILLNRYDLLFEGGIRVYIDEEFPHVLRDLAFAILRPVYDHKNIQGDINGLTWEERLKIHEKATSDASLVEEAVALKFSDPVRSGKLWQQVLGRNFPVSET